MLNIALGLKRDKFIFIFLNRYVFLELPINIRIARVETWQNIFIAFNMNFDIKIEYKNAVMCLSWMRLKSLHD